MVLSPDKPMTPGQVADLFNVSVVTVGKWADTGKLRSFRTPGGQRRFDPDDVRRFLDEMGNSTEAASA